MDGFLGSVLVPNTGEASYNYKITGNTADTIFIDGSLDLSKASAGDTFRVLLGKLVRSTVATPNSGGRKTRFFDKSGPNSFADGDVTLDGVCEVCHTQTHHFRNDGNGAYQNHGGAAGQNCTACHSHQNGFAASGGCVDCHSFEQGSLPRRAAAGEFPAQDVHAHYGGDLDDADCIVCHSIDTHKNGYVELLHPDGGDLFSFQQPTDLSSDPDLSTFCAACHDADGATRLPNPLDPFGNGNAAPDVATKFSGTLQWNEEYGDFCFGTEGSLRGVNSHHDISDDDQAFSGAKLECLDCHGSHTVSQTQPTIDPFNTAAPWEGTDNGFCLACHAGGFGPLDPDLPPNVLAPAIALRGIDSCDYVEAPWYVDYSWTSSMHGPNSKRGWNGYSGALAYDMDCMVCHDPHGSRTDTNPAGNPYLIRDTVDGTQYVDDGVRTLGFNGPPWDTFGTFNTDVVVSITGLEVSLDQLCVTCHSGWLTAYDWHDYCNGCQTCHAHGKAWGNHDWVDDDDNIPCPLPEGKSNKWAASRDVGKRSLPALHMILNADAGTASEDYLPR